MGRLVRFCKCAICAMAEKQKNAGGAKIKSFLVGSCVVQVFIFSVSVVIVNLIFLFLSVCLFQCRCLFTIGGNVLQIDVGGVYEASSV